MSQPRPTAISKYTSRQGPLLLDERLKNITHHAVLSSPVDTAVSFKSAVRRILPYQRTNDQNMKSYLKEINSALKANAPYEIASGGTKRVTANEKDSQKLSNWEDTNFVAQKRFVVKLPSEGRKDTAPRHEHAASVPSEASDILESTTKKDLQFNDVESNGDSDSTGSMPHSADSEVHQISTVEGLQPLDPAHLQSHASPPETDDITDIPHPTGPAQPSSEYTSIDQRGPDAEASPTPSITIPRAPPSTPNTTPKREIKLVTASSSAADWFTRGFIRFANKTSKARANEAETPQTEVAPPADVVKIEIHADAQLEGFDEIRTPTVCQEEQKPEDIEEDTPTSIVPEIVETRPLDSLPEAIGTSVDEVAQSRPGHPQRPSDVVAKSAVQTVEVISEQKFSFSINRIIRPYYRGPSDQNKRVTSVAAARAPIASPTSQSSVPSEVAETTGLDTCPIESKTESKLDEICRFSQIITPEDDGVKKRWFREEMRQRPERDGCWTVSDGDAQMPAVGDDAESNSSLAMEFVMVESTNISTSMTILDEPPVVIPLNLEKDEIIAEPVQTATSTPAHSDTSTTVHASKEITQRYVIRGGMVVQRTEPAKEESLAVPEPPVQNSPTEVASIPVQSEITEPPPRGPSVIPENSPQRKTKKIKIQTTRATGDSDGWSTDNETEAKVTSFAEKLERSVPEVWTTAPVDTTVTHSSIKEREISETVHEAVQKNESQAKSQTPENIPLEKVMKQIASEASDQLHAVFGSLFGLQTQQGTPLGSHGTSSIAEEDAPSRTQTTIEKEAPKYQIISGQVRKVSSQKSGPSTPSTLVSAPPTPSDSSTPHATFSQPPVEKSRPPENIKQFIECGEREGHRRVEILAPDGSQLAASRHVPIFFGPTRKQPSEYSIGENSQSPYSKTDPLGQPSGHEEKFDPFSKESESKLKQLKEHFAPMLGFHPPDAIASFLSSPPHCFCLKSCARFDGIVPVYVCGAFRDLTANSSIVKGCTFHMHVLFWEHLHDTLERYGRDKEKAFADATLVPHLKACPYLNFTFCVRFSKQNSFDMYLPAEIRATNLCACDLDMRLDFSQLTQQWVFSCPHYHQKGATKKCIGRLFAFQAKYYLLNSSPNLHGGILPPRSQSIVEDDKTPSGEVSRTPLIRLPPVDGICEPQLPKADDDGQVITELFRTFTANPAGSKDWLGVNPSQEALSEYDGKKKEITEIMGKLLTRCLESYLTLEKSYDAALCQKVKDEEQRKREEMRMRLKSNNISCMGCTEQNPMAIFVPCYHMVMCEKCSGKVKVCPACRRDITESHRVYIA